MEQRFTVSQKGLASDFIPIDSESEDAPPLKDSLAGLTGNQPPLRQIIKREPLYLLGYIVISLVIYSSTLLVSYGFLDSYTALTEGAQGTLRSYDIQIVSYGRPIYAVLVNLTFSAMHTVSDLAFLRLAAAVSLGVLAWMFYQALRLVGIHRIYALVFPLLICTTPPYEVFVAWESCAFFLSAAILAGAALMSVDRAFNRRATKQGLLFGGASLVLLAMAMMLYQPAAMVFCVFAAIFLLGRNQSLRSTVARLGVYCSVLIIALELDYMAAKILPQMLYGTQIQGVRTEFASDLLAKAAWFFQEPLVNALNLWNLLPTIQIALIVGIFSLVGLFFFVPGKLIERGGKVLIAFLVLPLSYLPNLVVQESWASYRTEVALTSLVVLYAGFALLGFLSLALKVKKGPFRVRQAGPTKNLYVYLATAVLVVSMIFGSVLAARNVTAYFALPQAEELSILANQLNTTALAKASSIYVIPCSWSDSISPVVRYDEFGVASCSESWVPGPMVYLLLRDLDPAKVNIPIIVVPPGGSIQPPPGSLVIDMRTLRRYRFGVPQYH